MDEMTKEYKCESCGSTSTDGGTCCGADRKEVCAKCKVVHKEGETCGA